MNFSKKSIVALLATSLVVSSSVSAQTVDETCDFGPNDVNLALCPSNSGCPFGEATRTCFEADGFIRCYYTYIPVSCKDSTQKVPLVVDIHGANNCPATHVRYSGWIQKAEEECLVILLPSSSMNPDFEESCFNLNGLTQDITDPTNEVTTSPCCCREINDVLAQAPYYGSYETPDDAAFVKRAIDEALANFPGDERTGLSLDPTRVYMAGHSNGCMTALSVAARYPETVAAVACHAGTLITGFDPAVYNDNPVPIWMAWGKLDNLVIYDGISLPTPLGLLGLWSHDQIFKYLMTANGCTESDVYDFDGESLGFTTEASGCTNGASVEFLTLDKSGHDIYNTYYLPEYGGEKTTVDTTALAWNFAKTKVKNPTPAPTTLSPTPSPITSKSTKKKDKAGKSTKGAKRQ